MTHQLTESCFAAVLTSQPANPQDCTCFRALRNSPVSCVVWHVTPAVTQWPYSEWEEGYRPEPVDWLARTLLISPLAVWIPADTCIPVPMPKHKFTFIWKEGEERYTQDKSRWISAVQCQSLSAVQDSHTNGPWREKFSVALEEQLKDVSLKELQSVHHATMEQNKLQNTAATVKPQTVKKKKFKKMLHRR